MWTHWDAIVIGAGLGGLSATVKLVQAGLRVLVLEKSDHPGGTAYAYTRKGFTFPMGPLGFSSTHMVRDTFRGLNPAYDLEFHRVHYQIRAFGVQAIISSPFNIMKEELGRLFPAERQSISRFFDDTAKILSALDSPQTEASRSLLEQAERTTARDYLSTLIKDWKLRRILGSLGTREPYTGLPLLAAMWGLMCRDGIWYPKGGMRSFCDQLAVAATGAGEETRGLGKIQLNAEVKRIRLSDGKIWGVTLSDGTEIDAAAVISNADYKTTFLRLIEPQFMPEDWLAAVKRARQSGSVLQVCLGIDAKKVDLSALSEASRLIFKGGKDETPQETAVDWFAEEIGPDALAMQELEVSLWSKDDPGLAPPGGAVIVIRTEADHGHFSKYRLRPGQRIPAYGPYKTMLGRALVRQTADLMPGIEDAIQVLDVATPLTFEDRGGRTEGAVAGWSWDFTDNPGQAAALVRTPISGLYMAGYQAYSALFLGGVPTAISSGVSAAEALLEGAGPVKDLKIPGSSNSESEDP